MVLISGMRLTHPPPSFAPNHHTPDEPDKLTRLLLLLRIDVP